MKNLILCFLVLVIPLVSHAEDMLVLRNGDIVKVIVQEIGQSEIKYKKVTNPDGPTYSVSKGEVLSITYENGDVDKFNETNNQSNNDQASNTAVVGDERNATLIQAYNKQTPVDPKRKQKNNVTDEGLVFWGFSNESILSTEEIEVSFVRSGGYEKYIFDEDCWGRTQGNHMLLCVRNKTTSPIYIDLANTFIVTHYGGNDSGTAWYDPTVISTNTVDNSSWFSSGLFGSKNVVTGTKQMERILAVPPMSTVNLPPHKVVTGIDLLPVMETNENFCVLLKMPQMKDKIGLKKNELREFTYEDSEFKKEYHIAFSNSPSCETFKVLPIKLYVRAMFGDYYEMKIKDYKDYNPETLIIGKFEFKKK